MPSCLTLFESQVQIKISVNWRAMLRHCRIASASAEMTERFPPIDCCICSVRYNLRSIALQKHVAAITMERCLRRFRLQKNSISICDLKPLNWGWFLSSDSTPGCNSKYGEKEKRLPAAWRMIGKSSAKRQDAASTLKPKT